MRYSASEKLEIIRLVEESALPVRRTLEKVGIPRATFYRWYDLYQAGGPEALDDRHPKPDRVWNRIPDDVRERIIKLALEESALSPRELAVRFTDTEGYFVSEASVYRLLKAHDLIASPAFIVMKAPTSSRIRRRRQTNSGRRTSLISRSSAGDGSTSRRCSTTSPATSSPGSCAPQ
jgi:putative transposase